MLDRGFRPPRRRLLSLICLVALVAAAVTTALLSAGTAGADTTGSALFGLYAGENNATIVDPNPAFTYADNYLPAMLRWQGRNNDVINVYNQIHGSGGVDTVTGTYLPEIWDTYGSVPMISLNTNNHTNAQVASGAADSEIDYYANDLKNNYIYATINGHAAPPGGRRVYIRLDWEMNGNFSPWEPLRSATTCANLQTAESDYVNMWRHFHDRFMATGGFDSTQVQWVYSVYYFDTFTTAHPELANCPAPINDLVTSTYPGNDYVDWVGIDGYAYNPSPANTPYESPSDIFGPPAARLNTVDGGTKPLSTNEVGISTHGGTSPDQTVANKETWIGQYFTEIESLGAKMSLWFNIDLGATSFHNLAIFCKKNAGLADLYCNGNNTYTDTGGDGKTYNVYDNYKAGVGSTYFISPDPGNSRLLTDAQFQGS